MSGNYYEQFLGDDNPIKLELNTRLDELEWVEFHATAKKAFDAINELKKVKLRYIKGHTKKAHFQKKYLWMISKAEVAKMVGVKPQPLFNSNSFSKGLSKYFHETAIHLEKEAEKQTCTEKKGLQHRSKSELKESTKTLGQELDKLQKNNCEQLFQNLLDKMPLDIKRKLGLV